MRWKRTAAASALAVLVCAPIAGGDVRSAAATLELRADLRLESRRGAACPPGTRALVECPARTGASVVSGLGAVSEAYSYLVDVAPASCPAGSVQVLGYPVRWVVAGKGEISFELAPAPGCLSSDAGIAAGQSFTVTGGTGIYAGATGGGRVERSLGQTAEGARGTETWTGTLNVPGLEFDVTRPTISGAASKTVRVPKRAKNARVRYAVAAADATDGAVPVTCRPVSGSRFKVGRTTVRCTAQDTSGNVATASFAVSVRRR
jgi:HYR domain-containing protein